MPVTELAYTGRWPEERRRELQRAEGQQQAQESTTKPPVAKEEIAPSAQVDTETAIKPLRKAAESLSKQVDIQYRRDIEMVVMVLYQKDPETGRNTEEVLRQIPPEEAVKLAQQLEKGKATILDEIA